MGTRGKRFQTVKKFEEPTLLSDLDKIKNLAEAKGLYHGDALEVEQLIREISNQSPNSPILIQKEPMDNYLSGSLSYKDGTWIMTVNSKQHVNRQRFTLAHELGHYILHKEKIRSFKILLSLEVTIWILLNIWLMILLQLCLCLMIKLLNL